MAAMTAFRTSIPDFELANPIYAGATVSFYTVDGSGQATTTLATLYAGATGAQTASNPQTLDGEGKFSSPVYIAEPVIGTVVSLTVASHSTGVIAVGLQLNGSQLVTPFVIGDLIYADSTNTLARLPDVATGSVLVSGGVGVAPRWSNSPVIGTSLTIGASSAGTAKLTVGSAAAVQAQGSLFTIEDPAKPVNGAWLNAVIGSASPNQYVISGGGALSVFLSEVDIGVSGVESTGFWFHHIVSKGTGLGARGVLIQTEANSPYVQSGTNAGALALQTLAITTALNASAFGAVLQAKAATNAAAQLVGLEIDTINTVAGTVSKIGCQVVDETGSTQSVSGASIGYYLLKKPTSWGFATAAYQIGDSVDATLFPLRSTASVMLAYAGSITAGIDLSRLTISGNAWASPGATITGRHRHVRFAHLEQQPVRLRRHACAAGEHRRRGLDHERRQNPRGRRHLHRHVEQRHRRGGL
jgi:hypothetical protein